MKINTGKLVKELVFGEGSSVYMVSENRLMYAVLGKLLGKSSELSYQLLYIKLSYPQRNVAS